MSTGIQKAALIALIGLIFQSFVVPAHAYVSWSDSSHQVLEGDINNDGVTDLFLRPNNKVIPVGQRASIPLLIQAQPFLLLGNILGEFSVEQEVTASQASGQWVATSRYKIHAGLFNADSEPDFLFQAKAVGKSSFLLIAPSNLNGAYISQYLNSDNSEVELAGDRARIDLVLDENRQVTGIATTELATGIRAVIPVGANGMVATGGQVGNNGIPIVEQPRSLPAFPGNQNYAANAAYDKSIYTNLAFALDLKGAPIAVGSVPGEFTVDPTGSSNYAMPISVPEGTNKMNPKIGLAYSSSSKSGLAGVGWSLTGISQITRCLSGATQGSAARVSYGADATYCLDGKKLVYFGDYSGGREYRTEEEIFSRIVMVGGVSNPSYWVEYKKSGEIVYYGDYTDGVASAANIPAQFSKPAATKNGLISAWSLKRVEDRFGNFIRYRYIADGGSHVISSIEYTGNDDAGQAPYNRVDFEYISTSDPKALTIYSSSSVGGEYRTAKNYLKRVKINSQGNLVSSYELGYKRIVNPYGAYGLEALSYCSYLDGGRACFEPTRFEYYSRNWDQPLAGETLARLTSGEDYYEFPYFSDLNGDGRSELIRIYGKYGNPIRITTYGYQNGRYETQQSDTVTGAMATRNAGTGAVQNRYVPFDLNRDGVDELIEITSNSNSSSFRTFSYNGVAFQAGTTRTVDLGVRLFPFQDAYNAGDVSIDPADADGDGNIDLLATQRIRKLYTRWVTQGSVQVEQLYKAESYIRVILLRNTGNNTFNKAAEYVVSYKSVDSVSRLAELDVVNKNAVLILDADGNGASDLVSAERTLVDGKNQIVFSVISYSASTNSFGQRTDFSSQALAIERPVEFIASLDYNGDNLRDIAIINVYESGTNIQAYIRVLENTAEGFKNAQTIVSYLGPKQHSSWKDFVRIEIADFNDDGRDDVALTNLNSAALDSNGAVLGGGVELKYYDLWNRGQGTAAGRSYSENIKTIGSLLTHDIDSDGAIDVLSFEHDSTRMFIRRSYYQNYVPRYLSAVKNGLGAKTEITYKTLASDVYTKESSSDTNILTNLYSLFVVDSVAKSAATSAMRTGAGSGLVLPQEDPPFKTKYRYEGFKIHKNGVGSLGFRKMSVIQDVVDVERGGAVLWQQMAVDTFSQDYVNKTQGLLEKHELYGSANLQPSQLLERTTNQWVVVNLEGERRFVFPKVVEETKWETDGTQTSRSVKEQVLDIEDQQFGRYASANVSSVKLSLYSGNDVHVTQTVNKYEQEDASSWTVGKVTSATVTKQQTVVRDSVPVTDMVARSSEWEYYAGNGALKRETTEPDSISSSNPTWSEKGYIYNDFGQIQQVTSTGAGMDPVVSVNEFDELHRWLEKSTTTYDSGVAVTKEFVRHPVNGALLEQVDINGLKTNYRYDLFGRKSAEYKPDGTYATYDVRKLANSFASHLVESISSDGSWSRSYYDKLGREFHKQYSGALGETVYKDTIYDAQGRVFKESEPYFDGGTISWVTFRNYDQLDRPREVAGPVSFASKRLTYAGFKTTTQTRIRNEQGDTTGTYRSYARSDIKNGFDQLVQVVDHYQNVLEFKYDADGNQIEILDKSASVPFVTTDGAGLPTQGFPKTTLKYDLQGNRTEIDDPDKGRWYYYYDVIGNQVLQVDAKGVKICQGYDEQNRIVARIYNFKGSVDQARQGCSGISQNDTTIGKTEWVYDTADLGYSGRQNTGALHKTFADYDAVRQRYNYAEEFLYDDYGRVYEKRITIDDVTYVTSYEFYGLADRPSDVAKIKSVKYPSGLVTTNQYNAYGTLVGINNESGTAYWQLTDVNSRNQPLEERLKNGVSVFKGYQESSGWIKNVSVYQVANVSPVVSHEYKFDGAGNLLQRKNVLLNVSEDFKYDELERLRSSYSNGLIGGIYVSNSQEYSYQGNGNTQRRYMRDYEVTGYKDGIGGKVAITTPRENIYSYGRPSSSCADKFAGPHAVTQIGSDYYCYDRNGNMTYGAGKYVQYGYNGMPVSMRKGSNGTQIFYGADSKRYKRIDTIGNDISRKLYLDGYEKIVGKDGIKEKHYIGGVAVVTIKNKTTREERYFHKDHLGSAIAISDNLGQIVQENSYDPWGGRRALDWSILKSDAAYAFGLDQFRKGFDRGFSGHEMLDPVGLVHMNGRVYDAGIGRFLSADPIVTDPTNLQSYNRYSYVMNNPLSLVDPSGYSWLSKTFKKFTKAVTRSIKALGKALQRFLEVTIEKPLRELKRVMINTPILQTFAQIAACAGPWAAVACVPVSMALGYMNGGFEGAVIAGLTTTLNMAGASLIGDISPGNPLLHGVLGGTMGAMRGDDFKSGFAAGFFSTAATGAFDLGSRSWNTVYASMVGGVTSKLSGGRFENGAITSAFAVLFGGAVNKRISNDGRVKVVGPDDIEGFESADAAAMAAYERYEQEYFGLENEELLGVILEHEGKYYYSEPTVVSAQAGTHSLQIYGEPPGARHVANYHTHPIGNLNFSGADLRGVSQTGIPMYLRNMDGDVKILEGIPTTGRSICNGGAPCLAPLPH